MLIKNQIDGGVLTILDTFDYTFYSFCQTEKANRKKRAILARFAAFQSNQSFLYLRYSFQNDLNGD